jgi:hypothetical protein
MVGSTLKERELFLIRKGEELNNTDSYNMITEAPRIELK